MQPLVASKILYMFVLEFHFMKIIIFIFTLVIGGSITTKAQWVLDKGHSKLAFIVTHHGISEVDGYFKEFEGKLTASKPDFSDAVFEVTAQSASINTDLAPRDNHLKSADIFDVATYPTLHFKSTSFKHIKGNEYLLTGDLTIKDVTKSVSFETIMNGPVPNPNANAKNMQIGMKSIAKIKRLDFGVGTKLITAFVGDELTMRVTGEFNKPNQ